jgi:restriction system protein
MAVPGYQDFMLPLVRLASDGKDHTVHEAMDTLAQQLKIAPADRDVLLSSGSLLALPD